MEWLRNQITAATSSQRSSPLSGTAGASAADSDAQSSAARASLDIRPPSPRKRVSFTAHGQVPVAPTHRRPTTSVDLAITSTRSDSSSLSLGIGLAAGGRRRDTHAHSRTASASRQRRAITPTEASMERARRRPSVNSDNRVHPRDLKCEMCFDQSAGFDDANVGAAFRRWYAAFQQADASSSNAMQEQYRLLFAYIGDFNSVYGPRVDAEHGGLLLPSVTAHPSFAVISAANAFEDIQHVLRSACVAITTTPTPPVIEQLRSICTDLIVLLRHIHILSGYGPARRILLRHRIVETSLKTLVLVEGFYRKAMDMVIVSVSSALPDSFLAVQKVEGAVEKVLAEISNVLQRCIDPARSWNHYVQYWHDLSFRSENSSADGDAIDQFNDTERWYVGYEHGGGTAPRQRETLSELVRTIQRLLLHLHRESGPKSLPTRSQYSLHASFLYLFGALLWSRGCLDDYDLIQEIAVLDVLTALIGWPPLFELDDGDIFIRKGALWKEELRVQWLAWRCLNAIDARLPASWTHYIRVVVNTNLSQLLLWTTWVTQLRQTTGSDEDAKYDWDDAGSCKNFSPILSLENVTAVTDDLGHLTSEHAWLVKTIISACIESVKVGSVAHAAQASMNTMDDKASKRSSRPTTVEEGYLSLFFHVFEQNADNSSPYTASTDERSALVRSWIRSGRLGTSFQKTFLVYATALFAQTIGPDLVSFAWLLDRFDRTGIWNVLYSDLFFVWKSWDGFNDDYRRAESLSALSMKRQILSLTSASISSNPSRMRQQCGKLLAALTILRLSGETVMIPDLLSVLTHVVRTNPKEAAEELAGLNCLSEFTVLLRECAQAMNPGPSCGTTEHQQLVFKALDSMFSLLFREGREFATLATQDIEFVCTLLGLVLHESEEIASMSIRTVAIIVANSHKRALNDSSWYKLISDYSALLNVSTMDDSQMLVAIRAHRGLVGIIAEATEALCAHIVRDEFAKCGAVQATLDAIKLLPVRMSSLARSDTILKHLLMSLDALTPKLFENVIRDYDYDSVYESLASILLVEADLVSMAVLDQLFSMLVDGFHIGSVDDISNKFVLVTIVRLLPALVSARLGYSLQNLYRLAERNSLNRWLMSQSVLVRTLVDGSIQVAHDANQVHPVALLELLCKFAVRSADAKVIFNALSFTTASQSELLMKNATNSMSMIGKLLETSVTDDESADAFFFQGGYSGLTLPIIDSLPTNGYTFFSWIRPEPLPGVDGCRLFSFLTDSGSGVEAFLENSCIRMVSWSGGREVDSTATKFRLDNDRWYFVSIVHRPSLRSWGFKGSEVTIAVDGKVCVKASLTYPMSGEPFSRCAIGASARSGRASLTDGYRGQISTIYLLEDAISSRQINALYHLGRSHSSQLRPDEVHIWPKSAAFLFDGSLSNKIIMCFHPNAAEDTSCVNLAPRELLLTSSSVANVHRCIRCRSLSISTAIHAIGGIEILYPLLFHFDGSAPSGNGLSPRSEASSKKHTRISYQAIFSLIGTILLRERLIQAGTKQILPLKTISHILRSLHPSALDENAVKAIFAMLRRFKSDKTMVCAILEELILDFRIWLYCDFDVQSVLLKQLEDFCEERREFFRVEIGLEPFLTILRRFYWTAKGEFTEPHCFPRDAELFRPEAVLIRQLRTRVFDILRIFARRGLTPLEGECMFKGLLRTQDHECVQEIAVFLFQCIRDSRDTQFIEIIFSSEALALFDSMLRSESSVLKTVAFKAYALILSLPEAPDFIKDMARFLDDRSLYMLSALRSQPLDLDMMRTVLSHVFEILDMVDFSEAILPHSPKNLSGLCSLGVMLTSYSCPHDLALNGMDILNSIVRGSQEIAVALLRLPSWLQAAVAIIPANSIISTDETMIMRRAKAVDFVARVLLSPFDSLAPEATKFTKNFVFRLWLSDRHDVLETIRAVLSRMMARCEHLIGQRRVCSVAFMANVLDLLGFCEDVAYWGSDMNVWVSHHAPNGPLSEGSITVFDDVSMLVADRLRSDGPSSRIPSNPWEEDMTFALAILGCADAVDSCSDVTISTLNTKLRSGSVCRLMLRHYQSLVLSAEAPKQSDLLEEMGSFFQRHRPSDMLDSNHEQCPYRSTVQDLAFATAGCFYECYRSLETHRQSDAADLVTGGLWRFLVEFSSLFRKTLKTRTALPWNDLKFDLLCFTDIISRPEWQEFYDVELVPALKKAESAYLNSKPSIAGRYSKILKSVMLSLRREDSVVSAQVQESIKQYAAVLGPLSEETFARLDDIISDQARETLRISREWMIKVHELTRERQSVLAISSSTRWKLDNAENFSRMRKRLVINFNFSDHSVASQRRDRNEIEHASLEGKISTADRIRFQSIRDFASAGLGDKTAVEDGNAGDNLDEDWSVIKELGSTNAYGESPKYYGAVDLVYLMTSLHGSIELTQSAIVFKLERSALRTLQEKETYLDASILRDRKILLADIHEVFNRRYLLRNSAIEMLLHDHSTIMFNFPSSKERAKFVAKLSSVGMSHVPGGGSRTPADILKRLDIMEKWRRYELSTFDYLMQLNSIAGRTYNDLSQYFVFPWILTDYDSDAIDLTDDQVFRDLRKPVGALNPDRLQYYLERYDSFDDPSGTISKFHYGTHYSSAATVAYYLLRVEPFTSVHLSLQSGRFDHADRQFHSLRETWNSCLKGSGDVKELIPEFFYLPEMFCNENQFNLGTMQTGVVVDDVVLPKWAKSAEDFVRINRMALESDYVSKNLHHWIDLIFGHKQTGQDAIDAHNVFYYLTYEGAVDVESITDPVERASVEAQIYHFGQTPSQLLRKPHPPRHPRPDWILPKGVHMAAWKLIMSEPSRTNSLAVTAIADFSGDRQVLAVDRRGNIFSHSLKYISDDNASLADPADPLLVMPRRIMSPLSYDATVTPRTLACSLDGRFILSCGHWDRSMKLVQSDSGRIMTSVYGHGDIVSCLAVSEDGRILASGCRSTSVMAWNIVASVQHGVTGVTIASTPRQVYHGHDDEITALAVNVEYDVIFSGDKEGTCLVHALRSGEYIRTIFSTPTESSCVGIIRIALDGSVVIVADTKSSTVISTYTLNGSLLARREVSTAIHDVIFSANGEHVVCATAASTIQAMYTHNLDVVLEIPTDDIPLSLSWTPGDYLLLACGSHGTVMLFAMEL